MTGRDFTQLVGLHARQRGLVGRSIVGDGIVTAICLAEADRLRLVARSLADFFPARSYGIVMRKGKFLSPQARAFVDLIKPICSRRATAMRAGIRNAEPRHPEATELVEGVDCLFLIVIAAKAGSGFQQRAALVIQ